MMDTSETYAKMSDCSEIQELYEEFKDAPAYMNDFRELLNPDDDPLWHNAYWVWLPRQDQLQEMYGDMDECLSALYWWEEATRVGKQGRTSYAYDSDAFGSMEQLWLAFVMFERYQKQWSNGEWVDA